MALLGGCGLWERLSGGEAPAQSGGHLKLGDIRSIDPVRMPPQVNLQVHVFELPLEQQGRLDEALGLGDFQALRPASGEDFAANGMAATFGRREQWSLIADKLSAAGARNTQTKSLLLLDDRGMDIGVVQLPAPRTITYYTSGPAPLTLDQGQLAINVSARPVAAMRGVAEVTVRPVLRRGADIAAAKLARTTAVKQIPFTAAAISANMSAGDFLMLGPAPTAAAAKPPLLGSLLLTWSGGVSVVRTYLIVCTGVTD